MNHFDIIIIGGGAVGGAIAYVLSKYELEMALFERNPDVAMGTSGKNSAVVHAGFNNTPGSLMAKLCVAGNKKFESLCKTLDVPYKRTGKLVVALNDEDLTIIDSIIAAGEKNGCIGLEKIDAGRLKMLEPEINGAGALYSANTAIFDPFLYTIHLCEAAGQNDVQCYTGNEVSAIRKESNQFVVITNHGEYHCDILINAAGLYSDTIAAMAGDNSFTIYPCRGEYFILDTGAADLISRPVYPVPRKGVGGLGVHLTTTIDGNVLIGPSAEYIDDREDYSTTRQTMEQLFREATILLPSLRQNMIIGAYTGIRAKTVSKGETNYGDFLIRESSKVENLINLVGLESPALTASLPIANMVREIISGKRDLHEKKNYKPEYLRAPVFVPNDTETQNTLITGDPDYGEVVCRCKTITKAEIKHALRNQHGAHSLTSIKNRTHAGMGRCQGAYCLVKLVNIIQEEFAAAPEDITYRHYGDKPFYGYVK
jgi:glycerol-3-phosphate dehydrogenase